MFAAIVVALVICGAFATPIPEDVESRIVGGRPAGIGEATSTLSIRDTKNGIHFCGGSIITTTHIMTAARCVHGLTIFNFVAVAGTNFLNAGGKMYYIAAIFSHPEYNPETNENDISVLRILGKFGGVNTISITNVASYPLPPGSTLRLSGWGLTGYPSTVAANAMQTISVQSISVEQCQKLLPEYPVYSTNVCTYMDAGQGACIGDTGSPLMMNGAQHGIVSWGIPCAKGNPDVYTSVFAYRSWISSITGE